MSDLCPGLSYSEWLPRRISLWLEADKTAETVINGQQPNLSPTSRCIVVAELIQKSSTVFWLTKAILDLKRRFWIERDSPQRYSLLLNDHHIFRPNLIYGIWYTVYHIPNNCVCIAQMDTTSCLQLIDPWLKNNYLHHIKKLRNFFTCFFTLK